MIALVYKWNSWLKARSNRRIKRAEAREIARNILNCASRAAKRGERKYSYESQGICDDVAYDVSRRLARKGFSVNRRIKNTSEEFTIRW